MICIGGTSSPNIKREIKMRTKLTRDEVHQVLTTNIEEWKKYADINEVQDLNEELTLGDISTIVSSEFYDDMHDLENEWSNVLDKHFLSDLDVYQRETFMLVHNIYNV